MPRGFIPLHIKLLSISLEFLWRDLVKYRVDAPPPRSPSPPQGSAAPLQGIMHLKLVLFFAFAIVIELQ